MTVADNSNGGVEVSASYVAFGTSEIDHLPDWVSLSREERDTVVARLVRAYPAWTSDYALDYLQGMLDGASDVQDRWLYDHTLAYRSAHVAYNTALCGRRTRSTSTQFGEQVLVCDRCGRVEGVAVDGPRHHLCRPRRKGVPA